MPTGSAKPAPGLHLHVHLSEALDASAPLVRLMERLRETRARLQTAQAALPAPLREQISAGPVDDTGWTLLARNAAVAAKLRQWVPRLEQALVEAGWAALPLRIKLQGAG